MIVAWRQQHPCSVQKREQAIHKRKQAKEQERDLVASAHRSTNKSAVVIKPRHAIVAAWFGAVFCAKRAVDAARFTMLPVARGAGASAQARRHDAGVPQSRRKVESGVRQQQRDMCMVSGNRLYCKNCGGVHGMSSISIQRRGVLQSE